MTIPPPSQADAVRPAVVEQEVPPRLWSARAREIGREMAANATLRGSGIGVVTAAATRLAGWRTVPAVMLGGAAGGMLRETVRTSQEIQRQIRNSGDAATMAAWLGPHTPPLGMWAIEPDFARLVVAEASRRPENVIECGSGITTLLLAMMLRQNGAARLYSLEHDERFAEDTRDRLERTGLTEQVELIVAPLARQTFGETTVDWYDLNAAQDRLPTAADLLVVDGPPAVEPWARWPALEVFGPQLVRGATVLMDDGRRVHERRTAYRWAAEHPEFDLFWHDTVKGTWRLTRGAAATEKESRLRTAYRRFRRRINPSPAGYGRWPVQR
jgi:Methyltransferase domain